MFSKNTNLVIFKSAFAFIWSFMGIYRTPGVLNYFWSFGSLCGIFLVLQLVTGVFLSLFYQPHTDIALQSVLYIARDVNYGWMIRYAHMNGASFFFICIYVHMLKGLYYGSYRYPRFLIWIIGVLIYILLMGTAFLGYVLPWGQMSFWAATVITNMVTAIPFVGDPLVLWVWGGHVLNNATLTRFYSLHFMLPFAISALSLFHLYLLHQPGSSLITGTQPITSYNTINFSPYYIHKDIFMFFVIFSGFIYVLLSDPEIFNHADNYVPANPMKTPPHIIPEWYFLPFYGILKSITSKFLGLVFMFGSIVILLLLPFVDFRIVKTGYFDFFFNFDLFFMLATMFCLGYIGYEFPGIGASQYGRALMHVYFIYYFFILPSRSISQYESPSRLAIQSVFIPYSVKKASTWETSSMGWHTHAPVKSFQESTYRNYAYHLCEATREKAAGRNPTSMDVRLRMIAFDPYTLFSFLIGFVSFHCVYIAYNRWLLPAIAAYLKAKPLALLDLLCGESRTSTSFRQALNNYAVENHGNFIALLSLSRQLSGHANTSSSDITFAYMPDTLAFVSFASSIATFSSNSKPSQLDSGLIKHISSHVQNEPYFWYGLTSYEISRNFDRSLVKSDVGFLSTLTRTSKILPMCVPLRFKNVSAGSASQPSSFALELPHTFHTKTLDITNLPNTGAFSGSADKNVSSRSPDATKMNISKKQIKKPSRNAAAKDSAKRSQGKVGGIPSASKTASGKKS